MSPVNWPFVVFIAVQVWLRVVNRILSVHINTASKMLRVAIRAIVSTAHAVRAE
jgi:hypothetical protein